jgi:uncharacterized membrane protein
MRYAVILAAIVAVGAALRLAGLTRESLWLDEGHSVLLASQTVHNLVTQSARELYPPFYFLLLKCWMGLFGRGEAAVRGLSALAGILTIPLLYPLGRRLYDARVGLLACALLAVAPFHVQYSQEARHYALLALLAVWSFDALDRLARRPTVWTAAEYIAASALVFYTHAYGVFILAAHAACVLAAWLVERRITRRAVLGWFGLAAIVGMLCAPWVSILAGQARRVQSGFWIARPSLVEILFTFHSFAGSGALLLVFAAAAATAFVALERVEGPWDRRGPLRSLESIAWRARLADLGPGLALSIWLSTPILLPFVISRLSQPIYLTRATIGGFAAFILLAARGVVRINSRAARLILLSAAGLALAPALARYYSVTHKEPWRTAVREIEAEAGPDDLLVFDAGFTMSLIYDYYSTRPELTRRPLSNASGPYYSAQDLALLQRDLPGRPRVWILRSHSEDATGAVAPLLRESGFQRARAQDYPPGIRLEVYERSPL